MPHSMVVLSRTQHAIEQSSNRRKHEQKRQRASGAQFYSSNNRKWNKMIQRNHTWMKPFVVVSVFISLFSVHRQTANLMSNRFSHWHERKANWIQHSFAPLNETNSKFVKITNLMHSDTNRERTKEQRIVPMSIKFEHQSPSNNFPRSSRNDVIAANDATKTKTSANATRQRIFGRTMVQLWSCNNDAKLITTATDRKRIFDSQLARQIKSESETTLSRISLFFLSRFS